MLTSGMLFSHSNANCNIYYDYRYLYSVFAVEVSTKAAVVVYSLLCIFIPLQQLWSCLLGLTSAVSEEKSYICFRHLFLCLLCVGAPLISTNYPYVYIPLQILYIQQ